MMPGRRILVVEDNPLNLKLVRDVLTAFEYDVVEAHSGEAFRRPASRLIEVAPPKRSMSPVVRNSAVCTVMWCTT